MSVRTAAVPRALILFALVSGPAAWTVHLVGGSALVPAACAHDLGWTIDALTAVTALVCVAGISAGVRLWRRTGGDGPLDESMHLLAFVAIVANTLSLALVLAEGSMHLWFRACQ